MILGVPPYDAKDVRLIIEKHIIAQFPEPAERNPNIPVSKNTVAILKRMMAKKPENRFDSWKEFESTVKKAFYGSGTVSRKGTTVASKRISTGKKYSPKKGKASDVFIFINAILLVVIAVVVSYFIYEYKKNSKAEQSIAKADRYFSQNPANFSEVLRLYSFALEDSKNTKHYSLACQKLEDAKAKQTVFDEKAKIFDETYKKAMELSLKRSYSEALDAIMQVRDTLDPSRKQSAEALISQLQAVINAKKK